MDEQVVPSFGSSKSQARRSVAVPQSHSKAVHHAPIKDQAVPGVPVSKKHRISVRDDISPAVEYPGKLRWQTPLRAGNWNEDWQSARELGTHVAVRSKEIRGVASIFRSAVAETVVASVGELLPLATVNKWLCLLCEYLELNADEQILVVCLLRKYIESGGKFVGEGDWARPQRWECVVAVACYLAVLLTEEFPGRTSMDLRELLGPNFRFGREQLAFLNIVDWRITVHSEEFMEVKECCVNASNNIPGEKERLMKWFRIDQAIAERRKRVADAAAAQAAAVAAKAAAEAKAAKLALESQAVPVGKHQVRSKKRGYAAIAPADDSLVPRGIHYAAVPQTFVAPAGIPSVPQWMPHAW